jgi:hypothetical protein
VAATGAELTHEPGAAATQMAAKLASHSRHVCFLFGAGTSCAAGLPAVQQLLTDVLASLEGELMRRAEHLYTGRNLEEGLTRLRRIRALLADEDTFDGLAIQSAGELEYAITSAVIERLSEGGLDRTPAENFATWAAGDYYSRPIEVFTVNYDLLIEQGLEAVGVPYFDGFVGSLAARFREDFVDGNQRSGAHRLPASFLRLWKLHGSLNWQYMDDGQVVRRGSPLSHGAPAAIYPSDEKYDQSRRVPFVVLHDRFRHALAEPETLTMIAGYSFGDAHLNEVIFDAARRYPRSETVALFRGDIPGVFDEVVLPNLTVMGAKAAIIGGERRKWATPGQEDAASDLWDGDRFLLGDFASFSRFLAQVPRTAGDIVQPRAGGSDGV